MVKKIDKCRICGNTDLVCVLDLGEQMLTGVFPREKNAKITKGPLRLVKCYGKNVCGLLQLEHSYDLSEMYGENYGYRSGLNSSMVRHLKNKVDKIYERVQILNGDIVLDIGSNDGTTLQAYSRGVVCVGYDPVGEKFRDYYPAWALLCPEFFSAKSFKKHFGAKAKVITSFSMFYDLENPLVFMDEVYDTLAADGIWVIEQSYMPAMLKTNSFDTVCHEHVEFYALKQIKWMADRIGFKIIDVEFNDVNGGSISVVLSKTGIESPEVQKILDKEDEMGLNSLTPYLAFATQAAIAKEKLVNFIKNVRFGGATVAALGASTKGNVLLQYCGLTEKDIDYIGEVNSDKFGAYTPGTWIPIIPESELLAKKPDYVIILPWHFKKFFKENSTYLKLSMVFPLPYLEVV